MPTKVLKKAPGVLLRVRGRLREIRRERSAHCVGVQDEVANDVHRTSSFGSPLAEELLEHTGLYFRFELRIIRTDIHTLSSMEKPLIVAQENAV